MSRFRISPISHAQPECSHLQRSTRARARPFRFRASKIQNRALELPNDLECSPIGQHYRHCSPGRSPTLLQSLWPLAARRITLRGCDGGIAGSIPAVQEQAFHDGKQATRLPDPAQHRQRGAQHHDPITAGGLRFLGTTADITERHPGARDGDAQIASVLRIGPDIRGTDPDAVPADGQRCARDQHASARTVRRQLGGVISHLIDRRFFGSRRPRTTQRESDHERTQRATMARHAIRWARHISGFV